MNSSPKYFMINRPESLPVRIFQALICTTTRVFKVHGHLIMILEYCLLSSFTLTSLKFTLKKQQKHTVPQTFEKKRGHVVSFGNDTDKEN